MAKPPYCHTYKMVFTSISNDERENRQLVFLSYLASVEVILLMNRIHSLKTKNGQMRLKHNVSKFFLLNI